MQESKFSMLISWIRRLIFFGTPARWIFGSLVTLILGSGFGFIAEYAAYTWAIYYGIRPPLEGIPYLKIAIATLTTLLSLVVVLTYVSIYYLGSWVLWQLEIYNRISKFFPRLKATVNQINEIRSRPIPVSLLVGYATVPAIINGILIARFTSFALEKKLGYSILGAVMWFIFVLMLFKPKFRNFIPVIFALFVSILIPLSFFYVPLYSNLLRVLGYGGGLPVTVTIVEDQSTSRPKESVQGYLMLRTALALIIYEQKSNRIREISLTQVLFIDHSSQALSDRTPSLPPVSWNL
jgi:hypothetical protein